jgi:integrase
MASILKRGNNWRAQIIRRGFDPLYRSFKTKLEAEAWARQIESEMDRGLFVSRIESERTTLRELVDRYANEVSPLHRGSNPEKIRLGAMARHSICRHFIAHLRSRDFADYRDERLALVKPATVDRELGLFQQVIEESRREWGIVMAENPVRLVRRPRFTNARNRRLAQPSDAERDADNQNIGEETALLEACEMSTSHARTPWLRPIVELALLTAMRQGELVNLTWSAVHLDGPDGTGWLYIPMTKNGRPRTVPLGASAVNVFRSLPKSGTDRIFPLTSNALKLAWKRALRRANINGLTFHDLRHEATSRLAKRLPNVLELASVTGHRDLHMLARYFHPRPEEIARKMG